MLPAFADQGCAGWGVKTPMGLPFDTCGGEQTGGRARGEDVEQARRRALKPSAVRVRVCLSSSHSSLMAEKAKR